MILTDEIFTECFIPEDHWELLKKLAIEENWDYKKDKSSYKYPILRNYIIHTYKRLVFLQKKDNNGNYIRQNDKYVCFNTGLLTDKYEEIFMLWTKNA